MISWEQWAPLGSGSTKITTMRAFVLGLYPEIQLSNQFAKIKEPVEFSISYRSGAGKQYKEKYTVDFSAGAMLEGSNTPKTHEAALKSIAILMQEMLKRDL